MTSRRALARHLRAAALSLVLLAAGAVMPAAAASRRDAAAMPCAPRDGLSYICGPVASEDIVRIPGTRWLIASGLNVGSPAHLFLIDTRDRSSQALFPRGRRALTVDPEFAVDCPGPPDLARLSTDGLALRAGPRGVHRLYAANHGDRNAIEFFDVDARGRRPTLRWVGCAPMPPGTLPNAVTPLPDGGLLAISFHDPQDPQAWARMARGEPTGLVLQWHHEKGFQALPDGSMSGGNGLALSADGREIYASAWSGRRIVILRRDGGPRRELPLPFLPDNIHPLEDGTLLVGGQSASVEAIGACTGPHCPQPWVVARVDPRSGAVQTLLSGPGTDIVDYACGGLPVDGKLYVTVRGDRRIVVMPFKLPTDSAAAN